MDKRWNWPMRLRKYLSHRCMLSTVKAGCAIQAERLALDARRLAPNRVIVDHFVYCRPVVVSKEGNDLHLTAERYWLVDPLDYINEKSFN